MSSSKSTVPFGPASIVGYGSGAATAIVAIIDALGDGSLSGDGELLVVVSAALTILTSLGRMAQAALKARSEYTVTAVAPPAGPVVSPDTRTGDPVLRAIADRLRALEQQPSLYSQTEQPEVASDPDDAVVIETEPGDPDNVRDLHQ
jgi:hypothetical protein